MVCGNTEVARDGLVSQPTPVTHPQPPEVRWPQFKERTMWLTYSQQDSSRFDLYVDHKGDLHPKPGVKPGVTPFDKLQAEKHGVDRSSAIGLRAQPGFQHGPATLLAEAILGAKAHTHLVGRIVGTDPKTAILVIDRVAHRRLESGRTAGRRGPVPLPDRS